MFFRPAIFALFTLFIFASGTGCKKSESAAHAAPPTVLSQDTIASVHWVGKGQLDLKADACFFSRIWSLPETERLQAQTFDHFSTGVWRFLLGDAAAAKMPAAVLRPLLDDLAQEEVYLEVRAPTNSQPSQVCLAIHVDIRRAGIWETNLAIASELLAGSPAIANPAVRGWILQRTNAPNRITLTRAGDWTVVGIGPDQNFLFGEITARIQRDGLPFVSAGTNLWLEASLDVPRLAACLPTLNLQLSTLNHLDLAVTGDGGNVITRGQLTFSRPLPLQLQPWHIPVNLLHEPLIAFSAMRGVQPWLASWPAWNRLQIGAPDQLYLWSLSGSPYQTYLAAPLPDAVHQIPAFADRMLNDANPWLAANGYVNFNRAPDSNGIVWGNLPDIRPFIKFAGTVDDGWLYAGLLPDTGAGAGHPAPDDMIQDLLNRTNLVYYDWEISGPRLEPCLYIGQTARQIFRRPQLPLDSASAVWLSILVPRLGTSATIISHNAPDQLTFLRISTLGFTAPELHLLADWLESPRFPYGLHSLPVSPGASSGTMPAAPP